MFISMQNAVVISVLTTQLPTTKKIQFLHILSEKLVNCPPFVI